MSNPTSLWAGVRHRFHPLFIVWITAMWCLLMGEVTLGNIIGGALVGAVVVFALPLPAMPVSGIHIRWPLLIKYLFIWAWELIVASWKVAWLAVRPAAPPKTAILRAPMRVENEFVLTFAVMLYNLQPGGTVTDIDIANRELTVHVLDADSDDAIARELASVARLERHMINIFEKQVR